MHGQQEYLDLVLDACPDIFNHNLETVERLQRPIRKPLAMTAHYGYSSMRNHADSLRNQASCSALAKKHMKSSKSSKTCKSGREYLNDWAVPTTFPDIKPLTVGSPRELNTGNNSQSILDLVYASRSTDTIFLPRR